MLHDVMNQLLQQETDSWTSSLLDSFKYRHASWVDEDVILSLNRIRL